MPCRRIVRREVYPREVRRVRRAFQGPIFGAVLHEQGFGGVVISGREIGLRQRLYARDERFERALEMGVLLGIFGMVLRVHIMVCAAEGQGDCSIGKIKVYHAPNYPANLTAREDADGGAASATTPLLETRQ